MNVEVDAGGAWLEGELVEPASAHGVVVLADGDRGMAEQLNLRGLATLRVRLLTEDEERDDALTAEHRFDVGLLAARLAAACDHVQEETRLRALPVGILGVSTGAAAAIVVAAQRPSGIAAVVSRDGRPELAGRSLDHIQAPTLLIVRGWDYQVIAVNEAALGRLEHVASRLELAEDATELACDWFDRYLPRYRAGHRPFSGARSGRARP